MAEVILKMDDLNEENQSSFYEVYKFCKGLQIFPSFGVIGSSLVKGSNGYISKLTEMKEYGVELWNHGFYHVVEEFSKNSYEQQKDSIKKTQDAFEKKLGYIPCTFGAPYNRGTENTVNVLKRNFREIENYFFLVDAKEGAIAKQLLSRCNCERVAGDIDIEYFEKEYTRLKYANYFVVQFHPGKWKNKDFELFKKIIYRLLADGNTIVTPSMLQRTSIAINHQYEIKVNEFFRAHKKIFLYGAGEVGRELYKYLNKNKKQVEGYIVSDGQEQTDTVCGLHVIWFEEFCKRYKNDNVGIIVAGSGKFLNDIALYVGDVAEKIWMEFLDEEYDRFIDYIRLMVT